LELNNRKGGRAGRPIELFPSASRGQKRFNAYGQPVGRAQTFGGQTTYYNGYNQPSGSTRRHR
jgi:hypothetical protein